MSQQEIRRAARRRAREREVEVRRKRADTERRCSELGVSVVVALGQRDEAIAHFEHAAAEALSHLLQREGLSLQEACEWAGDASLTEARRLLRTYPTNNHSEKETD